MAALQLLREINKLFINRKTEHLLEKVILICTTHERSKDTNQSMTINLSYLGEIMVYTIAGESFKAIAPSKETFDCLIVCMKRKNLLEK